MTDRFNHTPEEAAAYDAGRQWLHNRTKRVRALSLGSIEMQRALERISDAYPGDHDYPGIIARRALEANHNILKDAV